MPTPSEMALVDTNVLVESLYTEAPHHQAVARLFERVQAGKSKLCVLPQVLGEFYAVVTDVRRVTTPMTPDEALAAIGVFLAMPGMFVLPVPADVVPRWIDLARRYPVTRGRIFDVFLAAGALGNGVRRIYTFNRSDFDQIDELEVLSP